MSYLVKNTSDDRSKTHLHRLAAGLIYTPTLCGKVLRLKQTMEITDEQYEAAKTLLESWERKGMVEVTHKGGEPLKTKPPVPIAEVDKAVEEATVSEKPLIAEQIAAERMEDDHPKKGPKRK